MQWLLCASCRLAVNRAPYPLLLGHPRSPRPFETTQPLLTFEQIILRWSTIAAAVGCSFRMHTCFPEFPLACIPRTSPSLSCPVLSLRPISVCTSSSFQ